VKRLEIMTVVLALTFLTGLEVLAMPGNPIRVFYLDNGLQVITKEQHEKNLIAVNAYVKGGSRTETPEISGLSHYYEHLIFRGGTDKQAELETRKVFQSLGTFYGFTSDDVTDYYIITTKENLDQALWRHADVVMNTKITQEKVDKERQVVMEEYNMDWDRPDYRVYYLMLETAYKVHPYRISPIGSKEVILNSDLDKFRTFYQERYVPNQIVLACVGDFDTNELLEKIEKLWGGYPKGKTSFESGLAEPEQKEFREASIQMKAANSYMLWAFHIPEASHFDIPILEVLNSILSEGENSRLYQALKLKENLVLSVSSYLDNRKDPGLFVLDLKLETEKETKVVQTIFEELKKIAEQGVTQQELGGAKKKIENDHYFRHQSFLNQAQTLAFYAANSDIALESYYLDQIKKTTLDDLQRVARKYLRPTNCSIATVCPEGSPSQSLADLANNVAFPTIGKQASPVQPASKQVFANGLTLISKPDFSSNTVAVEVYVKGGLLAEDEKNNGISNYIARALLKGTEQKDALQIARQIDNLGINLTASSSEDYSNLSFLSVPSSFQAGTDLLLEVLTQPSFPEKEISKVKEDLLAEIKSLPDRSYDLTNKEFAKEIFSQSPYQKSVLGEEKSVSGLTRPDLVEKHRKLYLASNMVVAVVGAFSSEDFKYLETKLAALPKRDRPGFNLVDEPYLTKLKVKEIPLEKTQITFNLGYLGVGVSDPDYWPLKLVERVLSRRLFFKYVYEEGIAYRMWTYIRPRLLATPFTFEMGVSSQNFDKGKAGILGEVRQILSFGIPAEDLEVAQKNLITSFYLSQETSPGQAQNMAFYQMAGLGYDFPDRISEKVKPITLEKVNQIAKKYLNPEKYTMVVLGKTSPGNQ